jgi:HSP20 family molecular chaperone IbpA
MPDIDMALYDAMRLSRMAETIQDLEEALLSESRGNFVPFNPLIRAFNVRHPIDDESQRAEREEWVLAQSNKEEEGQDDKNETTNKDKAVDKTDSKPTTVAVSPDADNNSLRLFSLARPTFQWAHTQEGGFVLTACTPGLNKNDISVEVVDGDDATHKFLVVAGESGKTTGTDGTKATQYAKFERRVRLPGNLPKDSIDAKYEDGVLTVKVAAPPAPVEQPKKVEKIAIA